MNNEEKEKNIKNATVTYFSALREIEKKRDALFKNLLCELEKIKILGEKYILSISQSEILGGEIVKNMAQSEETKEKREKDIKTFIEGWKKKECEFFINHFRRIID